MESIFSTVATGFLPIMTAIIVGYGLYKGAPIYDYFIEGAKAGLKTAIDILPFLIGIYLAVNGLTASGFLNFLFLMFKPLFNIFDIPVELLPLMILRAISGSGSALIVKDIMEITGPDSYTGRAACVMAGGCETVIYVLALYFSVTGVKKMRHAFGCGIAGYFVGIIVALILCKII